MRSAARLWSAVRMDARAVLDAFNDQIRRHPQPGGPDGVVERDELVVRNVAVDDGWSGVVWSALDAATADAAIAAQIRRFGTQSWEWKHYSYDQPPDLSQRLLSAGFVAEEPETLLVAEIADLELDVAPPPDVTLMPVHDEAGVDALVSVHTAVFGGDHSGLGRSFLRGRTEA